MTRVYRVHQDNSITSEEQVLIHSYQNDGAVRCGHCGSHYVMRYRIGRQVWVECWCGSRKKEAA